MTIIPSLIRNWVPRVWP